MKIPVKVVHAQTEHTDNGLRVHNTQQDQVYLLNPTAALVWEHCDGQTHPGALAVLLQREFDLSSDVADEVLWLTLDQLEKADLLQEPVIGTRHVHSRRQVIKIMAMAGLSVALAPLASPVKAQGTERIFLPMVTNELTTSTSTPTSSTSTPSTSSTSTQSTSSTSSSSTSSTSSTSSSSTSSTSSTSSSSTSSSSTSSSSTSSTSSTSSSTSSTSSTSTLPTSTTSTSTEEDDDDDDNSGPGSGDGRDR